MPEDKKYGIIYADPPWRYDMQRGHGVAENHYPTMSIEEICALPVADLAAKDRALFLWGTFPQLKEAFRVIDAWGFQYKTLAFLWLKQNRKADTWLYGMGFWTRSKDVYKRQTILITAVGTGLSLFLTTMAAFVLMRKDFKYRNQIAMFFYFPSIFSGGLLPGYLLIVNGPVSYTHLRRHQNGRDARAVQKVRH